MENLLHCRTSGWKERKRNSNIHIRNWWHCGWMCRQIDFNPNPSTDCSAFLSSPDVECFFRGVVDKHKNASNKVLHFCPKKKISSTTILEDNSLESNYAAHKFSASICLCSSFEDVFLLRSHSLLYFFLLFNENRFWSALSLASIECWQSMHWQEIFNWFSLCSAGWLTAHNLPSVLTTWKKSFPQWINIDNSIDKMAIFFH